MGRTDQPWSVIRFTRGSVSGKGIAVLILHLEGDTLFHPKEIKRLEDWKRRKKVRKKFFEEAESYGCREQKEYLIQNSQKKCKLKNTKHIYIAPDKNKLSLYINSQWDVFKIKFVFLSLMILSANLITELKTSTTSFPRYWKVSTKAAMLPPSQTGLLYKTFYEYQPIDFGVFFTMENPKLSLQAERR